MYGARTGAKFDEPPDVPDAVPILWRTRQLNNYLGGNFRPEEVAEMSWLMFDMLAAMSQAEFPKKPKKGKT